MARLRAHLGAAARRLRRAPVSTPGRTTRAAAAALLVVLAVGINDGDPDVFGLDADPIAETSTYWSMAPGDNSVFMHVQGGADCQRRLLSTGWGITCAPGVDEVQSFVNLWWFVHPDTPAEVRQQIGVSWRCTSVMPHPPPYDTEYCGTTSGIRAHRYNSAAVWSDQGNSSARRCSGTASHNWQNFDWNNVLSGIWQRTTWFPDGGLTGACYNPEYTVYSAQLRLNRGNIAGQQALSHMDIALVGPVDAGGRPGPLGDNPHCHYDGGCGGTTTTQLNPDETWPTGTATTWSLPSTSTLPEWPTIPPGEEEEAEYGCGLGWNLVRTAICIARRLVVPDEPPDFSDQIEELEGSGGASWVRLGDDLAAGFTQLATSTLEGPCPTMSVMGHSYSFRCDGDRAYTFGWWMWRSVQILIMAAIWIAMFKRFGPAMPWAKGREMME